MDKILVFVPMYNCEAQIIRLLNQFNEDVFNYISEVIVVNNISTDNGERVVLKYLEDKKSLPIKILRNKQNYGLGGSHKVAFDYAIKNNFDYVIVLHGDAQGDISNILPYIKNNEYQNYDCLLGSRFMKASKLAGYSKFRTFGNKVYNLLFAIGSSKRIYDLGSGLNMYKTEILKTGFYLKYIDNLMFNYCMILGSIYYKHKIKFFPIVWNESDQTSNVKLFSQAFFVLKLLFEYVINKKKFVLAEHRDVVIEKYYSEVIKYDT